MFESKKEVSFPESKIKGVVAVLRFPCILQSHDILLVIMSKLLYEQPSSHKE